MADRTQLELLDRLPEATRQAIEYFSTRFESEWQAGRRPRIEGYLLGLKDPEGRPGLLAELLRAELGYRQRGGEQPAADDYLRRFPEHAEIIRSLFGPDQPLDPTIAPTLADPPSSPVMSISVDVLPLGNNAPTAVGGGANVRAPLNDTLAGGGAKVPAAAAQVPGYEILGVLGRGGMGIVYQARQQGANRTVALKMILTGDFDSNEVLARFLVEGELLARLQHPNIVQIYEVGTHQDRPYLALEYVSGGSLAQQLDGKPLLARDAARLLEPLARAVHHAHLQGVIHRDLKPGNILMEEAHGSQPGDVVVPKITDFGLARRVDADAGLTQTGQVMGTPNYMAPEQAGGLRQVGPPADIYALGSIFYQLLTGRTPFQAESAMETLLKVIEEEPVPPRRVHPRVPFDLEVICLKCLEKDPKRRYGSAEQLAEDLRRFLQGEPISARPVAAAERLWKWARRKPAQAALSAALVVILVGSFIGIATALGYALAGWSEADLQRGQVEQQRGEAEARRLDAVAAQKLAETRRQDAETARQQAETARQDADAARRRAESASYFSAIARARLEWESNNPAGARATLDACPPALRGWEWYYLHGLHHADRWTAAGNPPYVNDLAFRPDGKVLASVGGGNPFFVSQGPQSIRPGEAKLWDAQTGKPLAVVGGHANVVTGLAFSKDGGLMATTSCDGLVNVWETASGKRRHSLGEARAIAGNPRHLVAFHPDGTRLAAVLANQLTIWNTQDGKKLLELPSFGKDPAQRLRYSAAGDTLHSLHDASIRSWDPVSGKPLKSVPVGGGRGSSFSDDGKLAALTAGTTVKIVETATGQLVQVLSGHNGSVQATQFSPDGTQLATGGGDHTVRLWDVAGGTERVVYRGHRGRVSGVAFAPDGQTLASADEQPGEVKVWDLKRHPEAVICTQARGSPAIGFTADARQLVAVSGQGFRVFEATIGRLEAEHPFTMAGGVVPAQLAELSADGRVLACITPELDTVQLWELEGDPLQPRLRRALDRQRGKMYRVALSGDGRRVSAMLLDASQPTQPIEVKVWNAASGELLTTLRPSGVVQPGLYAGLGFSGDGQRLVIDDYSRGSQVIVTDLTSGKQLAALRDPQDTGAVALSADGRLLATTGQDGQAQVWDAATGKPALPRRLVGAGKGMFDLAFSPDGRLLAGVSREDVCVWELTTGQEVLVLRGAPPRSGDNAFNPRVRWSQDGTRLAVVNHNATISIWSGVRGPAR